MSSSAASNQIGPCLGKRNQTVSAGASAIVAPTTTMSTLESLLRWAWRNVKNIFAIAAIAMVLSWNRYFLSLQEQQSLGETIVTVSSPNRSSLLQMEEMQPRNRVEYDKAVIQPPSNTTIKNTTIKNTLYYVSLEL